MDLNLKLKEYFSIKKEIHDYFDYKADWVEIPIDDQLDQYWFATEKSYCYSPRPFTEESINSGCSIYSGVIYKQRFLKKWIYRTDDFTMVCADTQTDGNKFLMIFDNAKECKDENLIRMYVEKWSEY